tara:strand:- start:229 stop:429 length:201 start_codon:yes stop_codon:yes gene_type:complete
MILNEFLLVFIFLQPTGNIDTVVLDSFPDLHSCYIAMDQVVASSGMIESEPMNWDFVCLEDIRNKI